MSLRHWMFHRNSISLFYFPNHSADNFLNRIIRGKARFYFAFGGQVTGASKPGLNA